MRGRVAPRSGSGDIERLALFLAERFCFRGARLDFLSLEKVIRLFDGNIAVSKKN